MNSRGFHEVNNRRHGWQSDHLVTGTLVLPAGAYPDDADILRMQQQVVRAREEFTRRMELDRRSQVVDQACAQARQMAESGQFDPALEAIIAAVYLDGGLEAARSVVMKLFGERKQDYKVDQIKKLNIEHQMKFVEAAAGQGVQIRRDLLAEDAQLRVAVAFLEAAENLIVGAVFLDDEKDVPDAERR